ncbi:MAG: hypothetical protein IJN05_06355 [Ruminococcus sp.]|nr:hypothetical protein [Ruminococcus sp.]
MIKTRNIRVAEINECFLENICRKLLLDNCREIVKKADEIKKNYNKLSDSHTSFSINNIDDGKELGNGYFNGSNWCGHPHSNYSNKFTAFELCFQNGFFVNLPECRPKIYKKLYSVSKEGADVFNVENLYQFFLNGTRKELLGYTVNLIEFKNKFLSEKINLIDDNDVAKTIKDYLDNCDYVRARIQPYNSRWYLTDESQGHWELWSSLRNEKGNTDNEQGKAVVTFEEGVIARNPLCDVKHNAVIGIDFGTKSTIVAVQNDNEDISFMRVGLADYLQAAEAYHYENPTVMEFVDLESFSKDYSQQTGRPYTSWHDLKISHEAFSHMIGSDTSAGLEAFVSDLKQWAGGVYTFGNDGTLIIKDKTGTRYDINQFTSLTDEEINPIEIYAYYLGLFINNMHTGIYLDYILSFPETFSLEVKNAVRKSFERGIKKSLPEAVLCNDECMSEFRVRFGSSEPAAYAACALESFGIEPTADGVKYAVFDFGGGTTDFDFGIWKQTAEDDYYYDKILRHFGSGGDKSLGGENILQLMAYTVFTDEQNIQFLRDHKIVFVRPEGGRIYPGMEALIKNDEAAILNTKQLMEALRPIWEENETVVNGIKNKTAFSVEYNKNKDCILSYDKKKCKVQVPLFDETGDKKNIVSLYVDYLKLEEQINNRIKIGISSFFEGMGKGFKTLTGEKTVHIFLAGNSSRSDRVQHLFRKYMLKEEKKFSVSLNEDVLSEHISDELDEEILSEDTVTSEQKSESPQFSTEHYKLYPPLGTSEAIKIQNENGISAADGTVVSPTGKTGVAYGLIMCREGGGIKIESEVKTSEQIRTTYYIGLNYRKKFRLVFDRTNEYNVWKKFNKALPEMETFEFLYTQSSEAARNDVEIKSNSAIFRKKCRINKSAENAFIYFRFISPDKLEYVVAKENEIETEKYVSDIYQVDLG